MWGGIAGLVLQLIAGAMGGSVIGTARKQFDFGVIGNLVVGMVGGAAGAQIIGALLAGGEGVIVGPGSFDFETFIAQLASGAFGGGALVAITALIKENTGGKKPT